MTLFDGLQDLGRALGLPLGVLVTGPLAVEAASNLRERLDRAEAEAHDLSHEVDRVRERLWRLAGLAGHVPHESDNDATAELVVTQALSERDAGHG